MSLQCSECKGNICNSKAAEKLSFCVDGTSVHLVMGVSNEGRPGIGFRVKQVPADKQPTEENPYRSVSYVLCANTRPDGQRCNKKVGGVKCYPPLSNNQLIFFQRKALLVDREPPQSWKAVRESSLRSVQLLPAGNEEKERQFVPRQWPPLQKSVPRTGPRELCERRLTRSVPRGHQEELFDAVMESERNSLVYLPTGLGKTLVAAMVLKRLLELNPERQGYFLVETTALAMQQANRLQSELEGTVKIEMLVGSSLRVCGGGGGGSTVDQGRAKLGRVRAARIVVATAGAFEHFICKRYIDPDAICCVVLDEAHHCGKEHPFNRVAGSFLTMKAFPSVPATPERARELPKLVALMASPAGELTVDATTVKVSEVLDMLAADLATPVKHLQEVKRLTPSVRLELENVTATAPETALLACLERLVLSRVARLAPEASEVRAQAQSLLDSLDVRIKDANAAATVSIAIGADVPRKDDTWIFPNEFFAALCQRALASGDKGRSDNDWDDKACSKDDGPSRLANLMNMSFAVDEIGGEATWERVLKELEKEKTTHSRSRGSSSSSSSSSRGEGRGSGDPELEETIRVLKAHLSVVAKVPGSDGGGDAEAAAGGSTRGVGGSKLAKIASLLEQHKQACDAEGKRFSALVFVSRRDLALAASAMLEKANPFVKAQSVVGLSEMTLNQQRVALGSFRDGLTNVLVSTSVCGEWIDVPACALVVCASLPNSGTELVQLRGRLRSKENGCRFVGLTRTSGPADQGHLRSIFLREQNMFDATRYLSSSSNGDTCKAKTATKLETQSSTTAAGIAGTDTEASPNCPSKSNAKSVAVRSGTGGDIGSIRRSRGFAVSPTSDVATTEISEASFTTTTSSSSTAAAARTVRAAAAEAATSSVTETRGPARHPVDASPAFLASKASSVPPTSIKSTTSDGGHGEEAELTTGGGADSNEANRKADKGPEGVGDDGGPRAAGGEEEGEIPWKVCLPATLTPAARRYAATYLATCVRQALQRNPDQMARCTLNSAAQLAQTIKPVFAYDERKVKGPGGNGSVFEARCIVTSRLEELAGLILVKESKGGSIKAAREGAAVKVKQYLLSKDLSKVQPVGAGP